MTLPLRAEFHLHSCHSHDSMVKIPDLLDTCAKKGINRIAITDHNVISGAFVAKELDPEHVIIGEEIETTAGEILGYYMTALVPGGMSPMKTIEALKKQGALISVAHPFDDHRLAFWKSDTFAEVLGHVDALEVFNARCMNPLFNQKALECAEEKGLLQTVGSDAHSLYELGQANLMLAEFDDAASLRIALQTGEFIGKLSGSWVHLISRYSNAVKALNHTRTSTK
jgi:predicted metal-dependent phosphoesterase TrpH